MSDEIAAEELDEARATLATWWNEQPRHDEEQYTADAFTSWAFGRQEEFLMTAPPGGGSPQLYLVGGGIVYAYSAAYENHQDALTNARAKRAETAGAPD